MDERGNMAADVSDRPLDLSYKLEESRHHTEGHGAALDAEHSPEERCGISGHESNPKEGTSAGIVVQATYGIVHHILLKVVKPVYHLVRASKRLDQDALLEMLLHVSLDLAVLRPDEDRP